MKNRRSKRDVGFDFSMEDWTRCVSFVDFPWSCDSVGSNCTVEN